MIDYKSSPTGDRFLASRAFMKGIMGPIGSGKSTVALMDLFQRSVMQEPFNGVRRTKHGILRNTMPQLRATIKPLIDTWFITLAQGGMGKWRVTDNTFEANFLLPDNTEVYSEYVLLPADTPDDVRRLLSLELSSAWVEEAREVDPEVFAGLQGRVNRYPSRAAGGVTYPGIIFSTNPPPVGGFWHETISRPPASSCILVQPPALLDDGRINPQAENLAHLADDYYDNLIEGKTSEWVDVYLKNQFGQGNVGRPVFKASFKRGFHVAKDALLAVSQSVNPLVVGMDNGLQAAATMTQRDMRGRVNVLSECYVPEDTSMGVESFLDRLLLPHLRAKYPQFRNENILFRLDPACFQRSQVNEKTIAQAVQERGFTALRAPTNDPERRVQSVEELLATQVDGAAGLLIDPDCTYLIEALEWGYRYKKSAVGTLTFEKNHHSHCFVAGTPVLTPEGDVPIEDVRVGTRVVTPRSDCVVTATMSRTVDELVELYFDNGITLTCTPDHPFITERGVVEADTVEYDDVLFYVGDQCQQPSTPFSASETSLSTGNRPDTTRQTTPNSAAPSTCTGTCGSKPTAPSQTDSTSTTSTGTAATTGWKIWSVCRAATTRLRTWLNGWRTRSTAPGSASNSTACATLQPRGTARQKAENCPVETPSGIGPRSSQQTTPAHDAARGTKWSPEASNGGSARQHASQQPDEIQGLTTSSAPAASAGRPSQPTSTHEQKHVLRLAGKRRFRVENVPVYDLTVDEQHVFYANGVLVHNCAESLQYACLHYNEARTRDLLGAGKRREVKVSGYRYV